MVHLRFISLLAIFSFNSLLAQNDPFALLGKALSDQDLVKYLGSLPEPTDEVRDNESWILENRVAGIRFEFLYSQNLLHRITVYADRHKDSWRQFEKYTGPLPLGLKFGIAQEASDVLKAQRATVVRTPYSVNDQWYESWVVNDKINIKIRRTINSVPGTEVIDSLSMQSNLPVSYARLTNCELSQYGQLLEKFVRGNTIGTGGYQTYYPLLSSSNFHNCTKVVDGSQINKTYDKAIDFSIKTCLNQGSWNSWLGGIVARSKVHSKFNERFSNRHSCTGS